MQIKCLIIELIFRIGSGFGGVGQPWASLRAYSKIHLLVKHYRGHLSACPGIFSP
jgi:hypothetical protein